MWPDDLYLAAAPLWRGDDRKRLNRLAAMAHRTGAPMLATNAALWALYPSAKHVLPRMRALLDFLADWFRDAGNGGRVAAVGTLAVVADGATNGAARAKVQLRAG